MAISYIDGYTESTSYSTGNWTPAGTVNIAVGNLVVIGVAQVNQTGWPSACSDSAGNTYTALSAIENAEGQSLRIFYSLVTNAGTAVSFTLAYDTGSAKMIHVYVFSGNALTYETQNSNTYWWATLWSTENIDTTHDSEICVAFFNTSYNNRTFSNYEIAGNAADSAFDGTYGPSFYSIFGSSQSGINATVTANTNSDYTGQIVAFYESSGLTAVPAIMMAMNQFNGGMQ